MLFYLTHLSLLVNSSLKSLSNHYSFKILHIKSILLSLQQLISSFIVVEYISSHFHIGVQQIGKYLRKGYRLGLTDYSPEKAQKDKIEKIKQRKNKPVNVIKNNKLLYSFNSINECASKMKHLYNLYFKPSFISKCCEKIIEEYKGFKFEYAKNI